MFHHSCAENLWPENVDGKKKQKLIRRKDLEKTSFSILTFQHYTPKYFSLSLSFSTSLEITDPTHHPIIFRLKTFLSKSFLSCSCHSFSLLTIWSCYFHFARTCFLSKTKPRGMILSAWWDQLKVTLLALIDIMLAFPTCATPALLLCGPGAPLLLLPHSKPPPQPVPTVPFVPPMAESHEATLWWKLQRGLLPGGWSTTMHFGEPANAPGTVLSPSTCCAFWSWQFWRCTSPTCHITHKHWQPPNSRASFRLLAETLIRKRGACRKTSLQLPIPMTRGISACQGFFTSSLLVVPALWFTGSWSGQWRRSGSHPLCSVAGENEAQQTALTK